MAWATTTGCCPGLGAGTNPEGAATLLPLLRGIGDDCGETLEEAAERVRSSRTASGMLTRYQGSQSEASSRPAPPTATSGPTAHGRVDIPPGSAREDRTSIPCDLAGWTIPDAHVNVP